MEPPYPKKPEPLHTYEARYVAFGSDSVIPGTRSERPLLGVKQSSKVRFWPGASLAWFVA